MSVLTTVPPDFPIRKPQNNVEGGGGRGYVFIKDAEIADSSEFVLLQYSKDVQIRHPSCPDKSTDCLVDLNRETATHCRVNKTTGQQDNRSIGKNLTAVLLFVTFTAALLLFTVLLINLSKLCERRRGQTKEDGMVRDDMRWAEGREVVEKRIVWRESSGRNGEEVPLRLGGQKLARRQSWGRKGI